MKFQEENHQKIKGIKSDIRKLNTGKWNCLYTAW